MTLEDKANREHTTNTDNNRDREKVVKIEAQVIEVRCNTKDFGYGGLLTKEISDIESRPTVLCQLFILQAAEQETISTAATGT